jgi:hypothetical protein
MESGGLVHHVAGRGGVLGRSLRRGSILAAACALACGGGGAGGGGGRPAEPPGPSPVVIENARSGGSGWLVHHCATPGTLEAYASAASVQHGEPLDVHVRADAATQVTWEAWRLGWYGGAGGRSTATGGPFPAGPQPTPPPDPATGRVACRWPVTFTVATGRDWTSGVYLLVVTRADGAQTTLPFVVRADERKGVGVFQASFTTYQAYNRWGGTSLYDGNPPAVEVSYDRPFAEGCGSGQIFRYEHPFIRWAESRGFDLTYLTNLDLDRDGSLVQGQRIFLSVGHDEYWSRPAREAVESALASGTSLAFFSGNSVYWQIRLEPSRDDGAPRRTQVCWKKRADAEDPLRGTPLETTKWRLPPVSEPENALLGVMYQSWDQPTPAPWIVLDAAAWPYDGTGVKDGDAIPGIVGYETDRTAENGLTPPGTTVVARSPVVGIDGTGSFQEAAVHDVPGGAFVFAAGTIEWSWGLAKEGVADPRVQRITENVLRRAGLVPAR